MIQRRNSDLDIEERFTRDINRLPEKDLDRIAKDRKSTRLNSSHRCTSYAVFCLKKKSLPQDSGVLGLENMLRKLHTTARLLQTTAHPDDEDGGMLVYESRFKGADVMLLTLTRGD